MRGIAIGIAALIAAAWLGACEPPGPREVHIQVTDAGFVPDRVNARRGEEVVLVFTRTSTATCATHVVVVESGRRYDLPLGQPVRVDLPTDSRGTLHWMCGEGMYKGEVAVR
jgi:plastocyanin domain-containing protein